jgi:DNA modification methylase
MDATTTELETFLATKRKAAQNFGKEIEPGNIHPVLFPFQRDLVKWAVRKGRCAIFADTGLGKTAMQVEWAVQMGQRTLFIAPLSVARQTVKQARELLGVEILYVRAQAQVDANPGQRLFITNYEMIQHFDFTQFPAVVLDESSILKSIDGATKDLLMEVCADTPYRLCCTATPAPNDLPEMGNHSEFLGVQRRREMEAEYFFHDEDGYHLKPHAEEAFFKWLASWGMSIRKPSDLGYDDQGYNLPALEILPIYTRVTEAPEGQLFYTGLSGINGRAKVRKSTAEDRCQAAAELIKAEPGEQWIVWCGLDAEQARMEKLIPGCVSVYGKHSPDQKAQAIEGFQDGKYRVLLTKCKIAGMGMNLQNAARMVFVGINDSWETYYQAIRRIWRFGQTRACRVYVVISEIEDEILENVRGKEVEAANMSKKLIENIQQFELAEIGNGRTVDSWQYQENEAAGENWRILLGDSCARMAEIPSESVDFSVYSPPFESLYVYSPTERDLGNSHGTEEFFTHFNFIIQENLRITKPGRICAVHVADIPAMLVRDGYIGMKDFSGDVIRAFQKAGWILDARVPIDKNQQAQSIRTHAKGLTFMQMEKDRTWSRPALPDYILKFRKPGENQVPVRGGVSHEQWIEWANPTWPNEEDRTQEWGSFSTWYGIKESDTLQYASGRDNKDGRHIAPLQIGTIERCILLWSNPGELVFTPFCGIGSEVWTAKKHGRNGLGIELKPSYWNTAVNNLRTLEAEIRQARLF